MPLGETLLLKRSTNGGELDSSLIEADVSWSQTFDQAEEFQYLCTFHSEMKGTVVVQ
jgi:plastocyanin